MKAVYVQLAIVCALVIAYLVGRLVTRRPLFAVTILAAALSVFTLIRVFASSLALVQLVVIWGTWFILWKLSSQKTEIRQLRVQLEDALSDLPDSVATHASETLTNASHHRVIVGAGHRKILDTAIREAQTDLIIFSGWIATRVVERSFVADLSAALDRGANVHLVFGYQPPAGAGQGDRSHDEAVERLRVLAEQASHPGRGTLTLRDLSQPGAARFGNHAKVLICDDRFAVCGSNNWLANRKFANAEVSVLLSRPDIVAEIKAAVRRILAEAKSTAPGVEDPSSRPG